VKLESRNDLGKATEILLNNYKMFVKKELSNILAWRVAKSVENIINLNMIKGRIVDVPSFECKMNTSLTADPVFYKNAIAFPMDGSFIGNNQSNQAFNSLPVYIDSSNGTESHIQTMVSERTLNQMLWQAHHNGKLIVG
jgi:hypothetical protein